MTRHVFQFHDPYVLLALLILPLLFWWQVKMKKPLSVFFSSTALFDSVKTTWRQRLKELPRFLVYGALFFLIIALARPQSGLKTVESLTEGIDILLTVDTSGSMKALDFTLNGKEANRLDVVKKVVDDFISRRTTDRIGMVVFGEVAYTQCPLTHDMDTLRQFLGLLKIGVAGDGTAIGNALATSVKRLKDQPTKSKVVILLTDGRNNAGEVAPLTAAQIAKEFGIKVYTIGVGSRGLVPYPQETPLGIRKTYARLDLDEEGLKEIASLTGGRAFRATETSELEEIYATIDKLEKTEMKIKEYTQFDELYLWPLVAGILFLMGGIGLSQTVFLQIP